MPDAESRWIFDPSASERLKRTLLRTHPKRVERLIRDGVTSPWPKPQVVMTILTGITIIAAPVFRFLFFDTWSHTFMAAISASVISAVLMILFDVRIDGPIIWNRDRFIVVADLDRTARLVMDPALRAVNAIQASDVNKRGMLDEVANDLVLSQQLWEIAQTLRTHTDLRAEQAAALEAGRYAPGHISEDVLAVLAPQREALKRSVAAVIRKGNSLEEYALRVKEADDALHRQEMAERSRQAQFRAQETAYKLAASNDKYRDLLAQTHDEEGLRLLSEQARETEAALSQASAFEIALSQALNQVHEAAQTLALPPRT